MVALAGRHLTKKIAAPLTHVSLHTKATKSGRSFARLIGRSAANDRGPSRQKKKIVKANQLGEKIAAAIETIVVESLIFFGATCATAA